MEGWTPRPCVEDDLDRFWTEYQSTALAWSREQLSNELEKSTSHFWVLTDDETDERVCGFIVFSIIGEVCELMNIWVESPFRRKGMARRLIEAMVREAMRSEVSKIWLEVSKSNLPAINLYQSLNFSVTRIRKSYYRDGADAFEMELSGNF